MGIFIVIGLAVAGIVLFLMIRRAPDLTVRIDQIPAVVAQLRATGKDGSFAVFCLGPPADETKALDLQFSIEAGQLGLDWTSIAPRNIADKEKVAAFVREQRHAVNDREMNAVSYLRVEDGDVAALGLAIATGLYGLSPDTTVDLIVESFAWPPP